MQISVENQTLGGPPAHHEAPQHKQPGSKSRALSIAVVGGGIAGLTAARALKEQGHRVLVLDDGRKPAGRASTLRAAGFAFDHGAQYFTAREPRFRAEIESWHAQRFVAEWKGRIVRLGYDGRIDALDEETVRYVGVPGMSALAGYLASELEVEIGVEVTTLRRRSAGGWRIAGATDDYGAFDKVLIALPAPQAVRLLDAAPRLREVAAAVRYRPCWAVMLGLTERYAVELDGAFVADSALAWIARDSSKPGRLGTEAWVLHASPAWSSAYTAADASTVQARLSAELERLTGVPLPAIAYQAAHLWRYSLPDPALTESAASSLVDPELGLALAGDWCHGARVEGAFLSGLEAAERLVAEPVLS